jgi:hypothetical protein
MVMPSLSKHLVVDCEKRDPSLRLRMTVRRGVAMEY